MEQKNKEHSVLIVDDIPENIDILDSILKPYYRRAVALRGEKALKIANSESPPNLILLDIVLPDMDGYEVCRRLKANETTANIPVIFVSSKDDVRDETKGFELGGIDYITKPVSPLIVLARVKTHLELYSTRVKLAKQNGELREAARLRENVARMVHHDMKSPLQGIINYPDFLVSDGNLHPPQKEILEEIKGCGYKILHMINISLDMVKMEMGVYKLKERRVDLLQVIRKVLLELRHIRDAANITVSILLRDQPADKEDSFFALGEEFLCYSMLSNLTKNAFEAAPLNGEVTIKLSGTETAKISVHNDGAVPEPIRSTFFDKYTTHGKKDGTGLGTYSARLMANTQNGCIELDTSDERGTTITVTLPAMRKALA